MTLKDGIYSALLAVLGFGLYWVYSQQPKVGYVRTFDLLENYNGMTEAAQLFDEKRQAWAFTLDSLKREHELDVQTYLQVKESLPLEERTERELRLQRSQQTVQQYSQAVEQKALEEDNSMTQGVLTQVSDFMQQYGKAHGYTVILGTSQDGSLLYGQEAHDLTEEITKALNAQYSGKSE